MTEHYVSYEQAARLCEVGFDSEVGTVYYMHAWMDTPKLTDRLLALMEAEMYDGTDIYPAPRLDQAQAWLREVHNIDVEARIKRDGLVGGRKYNAHLCYKPTAYSVFYDMITKDTHIVDYDSYEVALSAGIDKAINLLSGEE